jgi:hypothetical protein
MRLIGGGNIKDYPGAKRKFPGRKKRTVHVSIYKYYGIGQHFHVSLSEEDNPIWDVKEKSWRTCWGDFKGKGRFEFTTARSLLSVKAWIEETIADKFPPKTHKIEKFDLNGITEEDEKKWNKTFRRDQFKEGD